MSYLLVVSVNAVLAEGPPVEWEKTFGDSGIDEGKSLKQTDDKGYILTGFSDSNGSVYAYGFYLVKLSADCLNQPQSDLTGDCKTDFRDFAIMSSEWLDCGQYDPNDCL